MVVLGLISGITFARVLGPAGRGVLALAGLVPSVLVVLGGLGAPIAMTYLAGRREITTPRLGRAAVVLTLIGTLVGWSLLAAVYASHPHWVDGFSRPVLVLAAVNLP